jgi:pimeloyl-ACP methyl ester carboxylesterase
MMLKTALTFIEDLAATTVKIRHHSYPVSIDGTGKIAAICIGLGSNMQMTLSARLKQKLKIYSSDLYWIASQSLVQPESLTMQDLVNDNLKMIAQLNCEKPLLIGFSCYGILTLEIAKHLGTKLRGVILVSTPPMWNEAVIAQAQNYFEKHASEARKLNDAKRKAHFATIRKPNESIVSVNAYEADAARYWQDYNISRDFLELLWHNIQVDDAIINHFFSTLLPAHDLAVDLDNITIPIILLAGQLDFDSIPLLLWQTYPKPNNFTIVDCGETGHWPNLEAPDFFDTTIVGWVERVEEL